VKQEKMEAKIISLGSEKRGFLLVSHRSETAKIRSETKSEKQTDGKKIWKRTKNAMRNKAGFFFSS
jgi:hypothetical protein